MRGTLAVSAATNASGQVSQPFGANFTTGSYSVTATINGTSTSTSFSLTNSAGAPSSIALSGSASTTVNTTFGNLVATVKDGTGNPVAGATVTFSAPSSGASGLFSNSTNTITGTTNGSGQVSVPFTANTRAGSFTVTATAAGGSSPSTSFGLTNNPGVAFSISPTSGSLQSAQVGTAFTNPLVATVNDAFGNPVAAGTSVTFTAPASGASGTFTGGVTTLAATTTSNGQVSLTFTANSTANAPASYTVTASFGAGTPASFSLSNTSGAPANIAAVLPVPTPVTVGTAYASLVVSVTDAAHNPVQNASVTFTAPGSGASGVFSNGTATITGTTNASGQLSESFTANTVAGSFNVSAGFAGIAVPVNFNLTNLAGAAFRITTTTGAPQSATVTTAFATPLEATVVDAFGNPVSAANVTFTAPSSGAGGTFGGSATFSGSTNASGQVSASLTANTAAGTYGVTAAVTGVGTPATFNVTNTAGTATRIAVTSGSGQSTTVAQPFGGALLVTVFDQFNNPVPGAAVAVSAPSTGATGTMGGSLLINASTNSSGQLSEIVTANNIAGSYTVTAAALNVATPASFNLTNTADVPFSVTATGGTPQNTRVNTAFAGSLIATVTDQFGNPVPLATVTFTAPSSQASGAFAGGTTIGGIPTFSGTTNSAGQVLDAFTANSVSGAYSVTATATGGSSPLASFALTNNPGPATTVAVSSGGSQTAIVNSSFGSALVALVTDALGNPVPGATVTFTAPTSGASGAFAGSGSVTGTTNALGLLSEQPFIANAIAGSYTVAATSVGATAAAFSLTNSAGTAAAATAGTPQSTTVATAFLIPLVVTVVDANNNPVPGLLVTFNAPTVGKGGIFPVGSANITGASEAGSTVTITAANSFSANQKVVISGVGTGYDGTFTIASATATSFSYIDSSTGLNPSSTGGTATAGTLTISANTDANGQVSENFSANTVSGTYPVVASLGSGPSATFNLTNNAGAPTSIAATSGSSQSATVSSAYGAALVATVTDVFNNPVPGVNVTFTAPNSSGASGLFTTTNTISGLSNSSGQVSETFTANAHAGSFTVSAAVSGVSPAATFALINSPGGAASVTVALGSLQSATVTNLFGNLLVALVTDSFGNPMVGVPVVFTAPSSGASGTFVGGTTPGGVPTITAITDSSGQASAQFTANTRAGAFDVSAAASGVATPAVFSLTNAPTIPSLVLASGTPQNVTVHTAFGALIATVNDQYGNGVPGVTVTFTAPATGASGTFSNGSFTISGTTGSNGQLSEAFTANTAAGAYIVSAAASGATSASFNLTNNTAAAANIGATSGTPQSTGIGASFTVPLAIHLTDSFGNPVSGATVTFTAPTSGAGGIFTGGVTTIAATTDSSGNASETFTANSRSGTYTISAAVSGVSPSASFTLTNLAGAANHITAISGTSQTRAVGNDFANLLVTVFDSNNNPVPGVLVTFAAPASGASGIFATSTIYTVSATTDSNGQVSEAFTAGNRPGSYTVTAAASGVATPASFSLTNIVGAASQVVLSAVSIVPTSSSAQSTSVGTAFANLVVTVNDANGLPVPGAPVTFSAPSTGAGGLFSNGAATISGFTGNNGQLSESFTANTHSGTFAVAATVSGGTSPATSFSLTNNAGPAAVVAVTAGAPQSSAVNTTYAANLVATVDDSFGNPLPGVSVTFSAPSSGAGGTFTNSASIISGTTDSNGQLSEAFSANSQPGAFDVTATATGATSAKFSLTNTSAPVASPNSISVSGGAGQSATVGSSFGASLVVTVLDASSLPVPGATVTFTAPSGASGSFTTGTTVSGLTDSNGQLTESFTANGFAGSYTVTAAVSGVSTPATFALSNTVGAVSSIVAASGTPQSGVVNGTFVSPLVATVVDNFGNPIPGVAVTFTAPVAGATGTFPGGGNTITVNTDANGKVSEAVAANGLTGAFTVIATAAGVGASASFALLNTAGANDTTTVNTAFTSPLEVLVLDSFGNPISGVTVTFAAPTSGASATFSGGATATTDSHGQASVTATANTVAGSYTITATANGVSTPFVFGMTNSPAAASKMVFASLPQTLTTGVDSGAITIQLEDQYGNFTNATSIQTILLSSNSGSALFTPASLSISPGSGSASFTYNDQTIGTPTLTATDNVLTPSTVTQTETVNAATATQLVITTVVQTLTAGVISNIITVQLEDRFNNVAAAASPQTVLLTTSSIAPFGVQFRNVADTATITSVLIGAVRLARASGTMIPWPAAQ